MTAYDAEIALSSHKNRDRLTGVQTYVVGSRQSRPNLAHKNEPTNQGCPFCVGGLEAPENYSVRWFVNRWPALSDDNCEVILYSPDHQSCLGNMSYSQAEELIELWSERTRELSERPMVSYVLIFENRGSEPFGPLDARPRSRTVIANTNKLNKNMAH